MTATQNRTEQRRQAERIDTLKFLAANALPATIRTTDGRSLMGWITDGTEQGFAVLSEDRERLDYVRHDELADIGTYNI